MRESRSCARPVRRRPESSHICTIYEVGGTRARHSSRWSNRRPPAARRHPQRRTASGMVVRYGMPGRQGSRARASPRHHPSRSEERQRDGVGGSQTKVLDFGLARRVPAADMDTLTRTKAAETGAVRWPGRSRISRRSCCAAARRTSGAMCGRSACCCTNAAGRLPFRGWTPIDLTARSWKACRRRCHRSCPCRCVP